MARGDVAGFIQFQTNLKSWDHAPGVLCVQESGGIALDANGAEVLFTDREFSVSKGIVCIAAEAAIIFGLMLGGGGSPELEAPIACVGGRPGIRP